MIDHFNYLYINNTIGKIKEIKRSSVIIEYENIPEDITHMFNKIFYNYENMSEVVYTTYF